VFVAYRKSLAKFLDIFGLFSLRLSDNTAVDSYLIYLFCFEKSEILFSYFGAFVVDSMSSEFLFC